MQEEWIDEADEMDPLGRAPLLNSRLRIHDLTGWRARPIAGAEKARVLERIRQAGEPAGGRRMVLVAERVDASGADGGMVRRELDASCPAAVPGFPKAVMLDEGTLAWSFALPPTTEELLEVASEGLLDGPPMYEEAVLPCRDLNPRDKAPVALRPAPDAEREEKWNLFAAGEEIPSARGL